MSAEMAAAYVSISETSLHTNMKRGVFPKPIRTTDGRRAWRRTDLDAWVAAGGIDGTAAAHTVEANPWD